MRITHRGLFCIKRCRKEAFPRAELLRAQSRDHRTMQMKRMSGEEEKRCGRPLVPTASGRTAARLLFRTCFFPRGKFSPGEIPKQHPAQGGGVGSFFWSAGILRGRPLVPTASGRTAARLLFRTCFFSRGKFSPGEIPKQHPAYGGGVGSFFWSAGILRGRPLVPTASGRTAARLLFRTCFFSRGKFSPCEIPKQHPAQGGVLFWYSRRESNPQRPLRRGLLYPFNYGSLSENALKINRKPNTFILHHLHEKCKDFRGGMRRLPKFKPCVHVYRLIAFCLVLGVRITKSQASDSIQRKDRRKKFARSSAARESGSPRSEAPLRQRNRSGLGGLGRIHLWEHETSAIGRMRHCARGKLPMTHETSA